MIATKKSKGNAKASNAGRIGSLVDYIDEEKEVERKDGQPGHVQKCLCHGQFNLPTDNQELQKKIFKALTTPTNADPNDHWVLSWQKGEEPTKEQYEEVARTFLSDMGYSNCCAVWGVHQNTANKHLHLFINRVDLDTRKVVKPSMMEDGKKITFDYLVAARSIAGLEYRHHWKPNAKALYLPNEHGQIVRSEYLQKRAQDDKPVSSKAQNFESATDLESHETRLLALKTRIAKAKDWQDLHRILAEKGFLLRERGHGAVVTVKGVDKYSIKWSVLGKKVSFDTLVKAHGPYQPPAQDLAPAPQPAKAKEKSKYPKPWRAEYEQAKREHNAKRVVAKAELETRIKAMRGALFRKYRALNQELRETSRLWEGPGKFPTLVAMQSVIAAQKAQEKAATEAQIKDLRAKFYQDHPRFAPYRDYAERRTQREALAAQEQADATKLAEEATKQEDLPVLATIQAFFKSMEEKSALATPRDIRDFQPQVFGSKVKYSDSKGQCAFTDLGRKIVIQRTDEASVLAALQVSQQKWGTIKVEGDAAYLRLCTRLAIEYDISIADPPAVAKVIENAKREREREQAARQEAARAKAATPQTKAPVSSPAPSKEEQTNSKAQAHEAAGTTPDSSEAMLQFAREAVRSSQALLDALRANWQPSAQKTAASPDIAKKKELTREPMTDQEKAQATPQPAKPAVPPAVPTSAPKQEAPKAATEKPLASPEAIKPQQTTPQPVIGGRSAEAEKAAAPPKVAAYKETGPTPGQNTLQEQPKTQKPTVPPTVLETAPKQEAPKAQVEKPLASPEAIKPQQTTPQPVISGRSAEAEKAAAPPKVAAHKESGPTSGQNTVQEQPKAQNAQSNPEIARMKAQATPQPKKPAIPPTAPKTAPKHEAPKAQVSSPAPPKEELANSKAQANQAAGSVSDSPEALLQHADEAVRSTQAMLDRLKADRQPSAEKTAASPDIARKKALPREPRTDQEETQATPQPQKPAVPPAAPESAPKQEAPKAPVENPLVRPEAAKPQQTTPQPVISGRSAEAEKAAASPKVAAHKETGPTPGQSEEREKAQAAPRPDQPTDLKARYTAMLARVTEKRAKKTMLTPEQPKAQQTIAKPVISDTPTAEAADRAKKQKELETLKAELAAAKEREEVAFEKYADASQVHRDAAKAQERAQVDRNGAYWHLDELENRLSDKDRAAVRKHQRPTGASGILFKDKHFVRAAQEYNAALDELDMRDKVLEQAQQTTYATERHADSLGREYEQAKATTKAITAKVEKAQAALLTPEQKEEIRRMALTQKQAEVFGRTLRNALDDWTSARNGTLLEQDRRREEAMKLWWKAPEGERPIIERKILAQVSEETAQARSLGLGRGR